MGLFEGDLTRDVKVCFAGIEMPRVESKIPMRPCTRPVLEHLLARAALERDNIELLKSATVLELRGSRTVAGARIKIGSGEERVIAADWIVDASGRRSKVLEWLASFLDEEVAEETVDAGVTYSSCIFRPSPNTPDDWMFIANAPTFPGTPVSSALMQITGGRWLGAVISYCRASPPRTVEEMVDVMSEQLPSPYSGYIQGAEPLGKMTRYSKTGNRLRRFGRVSIWPDRFTVIGDAACVFNPRYGQGMTMAAIAVETLDSMLSSHWSRWRTLDGLSSLFQKKLEQELSLPWKLALMEDRLWEAQLNGRAPGALDSIKMKSVKRVLDTVFSDIDTYIRFMRVSHMLDSPSHFLTPATLAKIAIPRLRSVAV